MNAHANKIELDEANNNELDEAALFADQAQLYAQLGTLSPAQYGKERQALAEELGINVIFLDAEWKERRKAQRGNSSRHETSLFPADEPWEFPVNGANLLSK